jgi:hypothetical protein
VYLLFLALSVLIVFGIVDANLRRPEHWIAAGKSKLRWLLIQIFVPLVGTILYLVRIRPKLQAAALAA